MKKLAFLLFLLISIGLAHSAPQEATLIIKYPYHSMAFLTSEAAKVSINGSEPILMDPEIGAGDTLTKVIKVPAGIVTIESSHWKREDTNYINKIEVQGGKTYTVVIYMMLLQTWDTLFSAMQSVLIKNLEPEKETFKNFTIKNQIILIK